MKQDPVLRGPRVYTERGERYRITAHGGLHYIRGNSAPYFSITADQDVAIGGCWREDSGGCLHELILRFWPDLADLVALHLSDIDGAPMHAAANGWYDLAGALGGAGERYHVGNSERHFPITPDPATPWKNSEYRYPTLDECLTIFADHCRIPRVEAAMILHEVQCELGPEQESHSAPAHRRSDIDRAKARLAVICDSMRPRWKAEAEACIAKHGLVVYGDEWK